MWGLNAKVAHLYLKNLKRRSFMEGDSSKSQQKKSQESEMYIQVEDAAERLSFAALCNVDEFKGLQTRIIRKNYA